MPKATKSAKTTRRTKVNDLPKSKKDLTAKSLKKVKGGAGESLSVRKAGEKPVEY